MLGQMARTRYKKTPASAALGKAPEESASSTAPEESASTTTLEETASAENSEPKVSPLVLRPAPVRYMLAGPTRVVLRQWTPVPLVPIIPTRHPIPIRHQGLVLVVKDKWPEV